MTIAYVNSADLGNNGGGGANLVGSYTVTSGSSVLLVWVSSYVVSGNSFDVSGVTYAGNACTMALNGTDATLRRFGSIWYLANPPAGTANVVVSGADYISAGVSEYSGTATSPEATLFTVGAVNAGSVTGAITTIAANAWVIAGDPGSLGYLYFFSCVNYTNRVSSADNTLDLGEYSNNPVVSPGSVSITLARNGNAGSGYGLGGYFLSFAPAGAAAAAVAGWEGQGLQTPSPRPFRAIGGTPT